MRPRRGRDRGFAIVEIVVVLAIIGILAGLLLPAVMSAREAARRAQCANNLHQIGVAMHSYVAALGTMPRGSSGHGYSAHTMLLPYLDQNNLYNSINFDNHADDTRASSPNDTAATRSLSVFLCPSDTDPPNHFGWTNYAGNRGTGFQVRNRHDGSFPFETVGFRDFTDGTSTTAAMSEWVRGPGAAGGKDRLRSIFRTLYPLANPKNLKNSLMLA